MPVHFAVAKQRQQIGQFGEFALGPHHALRLSESALACTPTTKCGCGPRRGRPPWSIGRPSRATLCTVAPGSYRKPISTRSCSGSFATHDSKASTLSGGGGISRRALGQLLDQPVAEAEPAAGLPLAIGEHLVVGDLARPGREVRPQLIFVGMTPDEEIGLLQHFLGVVAVGNQGADVAGQLLLHVGQQLDDLVVALRCRFVHPTPHRGRGALPAAKEIRHHTYGADGQNSRSPISQVG